jgi:hypothetical protein
MQPDQRLSSILSAPHVPPPAPPLHRGGRRPPPTADPRSLDGLSRPGSLRYPPYRRRRGPSLRSAPRLPSVPLPPPRGDRAPLHLLLPTTSPPRQEWNKLVRTGLRCATAASEGSPGRAATPAGAATSAATRADNMLRCGRLCTVSPRSCL